jgi:putative NADPH-quinone reductase
MHGRPLQEFAPVVEQTALFCGMRWEEPLVIYGAHRVPPDVLDGAASSYRDRLQELVSRPKDAP